MVLSQVDSLVEDGVVDRYETNTEKIMTLDEEDMASL